MKKVNKKSKGKHMDDKDKISLTDVNKTKKTGNLPKLSSPLKKQKGPKRDEEGKFAATSGGGGLKTAKPFNWKRALPLIAVITLVGGFFVYQSFAATLGSKNGSLSRGTNKKLNCREWGKARGIRVEFYSAGSETPSINHYWLYETYQKLFKVLPTVPPAENNEVYYWMNREKELYKQYANDLEMRACGGVLWQIYQEIQKSTPQGLAKREADQKAKGSDVLMTIYADQILPRGYLVNHYVKQYVHTRAGFAVVPIKPFYSSISGRWQGAWPDKIKVCAIVYNAASNGSKQFETKVTMNVSATGQFKKTQILEQLPNLNSGGGWPKYEVCSSTIPKTYVQPATAGRPAITNPPSSAYSSWLDMVSIKDTTNPDSPYNKTYKWDTTPNDYKVFLEQYQIRKAE